MPRSAIVLVFDRLQAAYLGPYGNHSVPTPAWNALAAESLLMENHLADSNDLAAAYRAWWSGGNAWSGAELEPLAAMLEAHNVSTELLTDEPELLEHPLAEAFQFQSLTNHDDPPAGGVAPQDSQLAAMLAGAADGLTDHAGQPFLRWVHLRALAGPWDAPYELRLAMADEDDPDPPRYLQPDDRELPADYDPDELLGISQAYAAQVMLTDMGLGMFLDALEDSGQASETLLVCMSPRGFPLGEHRIVGTGREVLTSEATHVPLVLRFPDGRAAATRELGLSHPADLYATLCDWFELPAPEAAPWRQSLLPSAAGEPVVSRGMQAIIGADRLALRTPEWLLAVDRRAWEQDAERGDFILDRETTELYAKPDDRTEFNNVFGLCQREAHELAEELRKVLAE